MTNLVSMDNEIENAIVQILQNIFHNYATDSILVPSYITHEYEEERIKWFNEDDVNKRPKYLSNKEGAYVYKKRKGISDYDDDVLFYYKPAGKFLSEHEHEINIEGVILERYSNGLLKAILSTLNLFIKYDLMTQAITIRFHKQGENNPKFPFFIIKDLNFEFKKIFDHFNKIRIINLESEIDEE